MDVYTAIRTRRDTEAFSSEPPPREVVERLIEAAIWAPNHRLTEPWRFTVVAGEHREAMADAVARSLEASGATEGAVRSMRGKVMRSPVTVFVSQVGSDDPERDREDYAACACAIQNMLLAAHAEGLAAHLSTDRMISYEGTRDYLGMASGDHVVAMVHLGYAPAGGAPKEGVRQPPVTRWDW